MTADQRMRTIRLFKWVKDNPEIARELGISMKQAISEKRDVAREGARGKEGGSNG